MARQIAEASTASSVVVVSAVQCEGQGIPCGDTSDCRYQVAWSINPHMRVGAVDFVRARGQHAELKRVLARAGALVLELPFVHGAFDSVFAKDPALLFQHRAGRRALLARAAHAERRVEQAARARFYESLGYEVVDPPPVPWEGGDVVLLPPGDRLLFGYGPRSDRRAAAWLERHSHARVVPLELCDPHFFHLDTALGVLPDGTLLLHEAAFTRDSLRRLGNERGIRDIVSVPRDEALAFALNFVAIGDVIITAANAPTLRRALQARGYRSIVVALDEFHNAGGSAACLATRLHRDPRDLPVARAAEVPRRDGPPSSRSTWTFPS